MSGASGRGRALLLLWAAAVGCAHGQAGSHDGIAGSREDAHVQDGTHDGWMVKVDCDLSNSVTVIGTGTHWSNDVAPGSPDVDRGKALEDFQRLLEGQLSGLRSVHATGPVYACSGMAGGFTLSDWREVDRAVEIAARTLTEHDLREQVVLIVSAGAAPGSEIQDDAAP
jgi:hypothetical protein